MHSQKYYMNMFYWNLVILENNLKIEKIKVEE